MQAIELAYKASKALVNALGDKITGIALFGSWARNEACEYSDADFFIVVKEFKEEGRRFTIYHHLYNILKRDITIIDVDEENLFKEELTITPLLLNIAWDSIILYDPSGKLEKLFKRIKDAVKDKLERYRTKDGKYGWKPKDKYFTTIMV
ncbi:nucleotidyltransferase domain-containing protein [Candidatus Bathyarchaeota archaeon]|nr:nucleotidyltransferase domain-containing protein [Candidatus Bathyarchaeota archaeon]